MADLSDYQIVMRTVDRGTTNYLTNTIASLADQGVPPERIHLFPTAPNIRYISPRTLRRCTLHAPARQYRATENMGVALLGAPQCAWVIHLEDDVRLCADFVGSASRWLDAHATEAHRLFTFFAPDARLIRPSIVLRRPTFQFPIEKWASAVAVAMRGADAGPCGRWILDAAPTWRVGPSYPPWANHRGSDKMLAAWQAQAYPDVREALGSCPCFVQHLGKVSSLSRFGRFRYVTAPVFDGLAWEPR